jgi:hypothetical protein
MWIGFVLAVVAGIAALDWWIIGSRSTTSREQADRPAWLEPASALQRLTYDVA